MVQVRRSVVGRAVVAAVVVTAWLLPAAAASSEGPTSYGYTGGVDPVRAPDSRDHWHCKDNFDVNQDWLDSAMTQLDSQTVMSRHDAASCGSATDVVWVKTALNGLSGGASTGRATCVSHVAWGVCEQFWVQIDQPKHFVLAASEGGSNPSGWYSVNLQATMRHELGHTAGLHHYDGELDSAYGAMNSSWIPNGYSYTFQCLAYAGFQVTLINDHL